MTNIVIVGCGYVGERLASRLVEQNAQVRATTTTEEKLAQLAALGTTPVLLRPEDPGSYAKALRDAEVVVHLAPTPGGIAPADEAARFADACGPRLSLYLYGSTTGTFGDHGPGVWIDETTPSRNPAPRGKARLDFERGLRQAGLPLRVVRIAGIYGPGRTLAASMAHGSLVLFEDGPPTSRVHVDDLVRLIEAMMGEAAPPLAIACDDDPAPTLEVARYTAALLGREAPAPMSREEALGIMSPAAIEMRFGGRRCRSLVREELIGPLRYPTYREGVKASLAEEGVLDAAP